jgi:DnaJ-class molecular chaperone
MKYVLTDHGDNPVADLSARKVSGLKVQVSLRNGFLEIKPEGYGEPEAADGHGSPVFLEVYNGHLRVIVTTDINDADSRQIIDLEGAKESARICPRCKGVGRVVDHEEPNASEDGLMPCPHCEGGG